MKQLNLKKFGPWAIVTGASSGIGQEFARQLAASGFNLVLVARRLPLLNTLAKELVQAHNVDVRVAAIDLMEESLLEPLVEVTKGLKIGLLVSNAGTGHPGDFLSMPYETLAESVDLNVRSHLKLVHYYGRLMAQRGKGGILLVSAMGASEGLPYMANDAATKAYITSLGEGLNVEFAKHGINVSVLLPGPTETPILDKFGFDAAAMPVKPIPVAQCVSEGLAALQRNKASHLSGRLNRIMTTVVPVGIRRRLLGSMIAQGVSKQQQRQPVPGPLNQNNIHENQQRPYSQSSRKCG